jgi:hypothetical protein
VAKVKAIIFGLELIVDTSEITPAIGCQKTSRVYLFLAVSEACAVDTCDALIPRKLAERFRVRNADQLGSLWTVTDIIRMAVSI